MENNIVNLFNRRPVQDRDKAISLASAPPASNGAESSEGAGVPGDFAAIAERNRQLQDKLRKERDQANKAVLKSYRIK